VSWGFQRHHHLIVDFTFDIVPAVALAAVLVLVGPSIALYSRPRRQRERVLRNESEHGKFVGSVYLSPRLLAFIDREAGSRMNPYAESVTLISTPSAIEFWTGGPTPSRAAAIAISEIETVRFDKDEDHFVRPELRTSTGVIPLYATAGWIRVSRKSSQWLFSRLVVTLDEAQNSFTSGT
jgi:hypothetical protein